MAIPFFMLAGELMNKGGITAWLSRSPRLHRLVCAAARLRQHPLLHAVRRPDRLAVADTSALGSMLIPAMEKNVYAPVCGSRYGRSVDADYRRHGDHLRHDGGLRRGLAGGIIPHSRPGLMLVRPWHAGEGCRLPVHGHVGGGRELFRHAIPALLTPVIILGGILVGVFFTPTEASAAAVAYALSSASFMALTFQNCRCCDAAATSSVVVPLLARHGVQDRCGLSHAASDSN